jgi:hypothetical protein
MGRLLDIAALLLWIVTAAAGLPLLAARRPARGSGEPESAPAEVPAAASSRSPAGVPPEAAAAYAAGAKVPPISQTRVATRPGEHPLLEFMHPALGIVGLGGWLAFVITRFRGFAWVALGVIVVTIAAGLTWYTISARARRAGGHDPARPLARRLVIHGSGAAVTLVLAIVAALTAGHA